MWLVSGWEGGSSRLGTIHMWLDSIGMGGGFFRSRDNSHVVR